MDGVPLKMDGIISAYVVREFPVYLGIVLIMGLLAAGLSTLEGLIQSVPTSITADILGPLLGDRLGRGELRERRLILMNKRGNSFAGPGHNLAFAGPAAASQPECGNICPERRLRLFLCCIHSCTVRYFSKKCTACCTCSGCC
ncbi:MAG: hypothetical protein R3B47_02665 [Bacteroidia bacterium]